MYETHTMVVFLYMHALNTIALATPRSSLQRGRPKHHRRAPGARMMHTQPLSAEGSAGLTRCAGDEVRRTPRSGTNRLGKGFVPTQFIYVLLQSLGGESPTQESSPGQQNETVTTRSERQTRRQRERCQSACCFSTPNGPPANAPTSLSQSVHACCLNTKPCLPPPLSSPTRRR